MHISMFLLQKLMYPSQGPKQHFIQRKNNDWWHIPAFENGECNIKCLKSWTT